MQHIEEFRENMLSEEFAEEQYQRLLQIQQEGRTSILRTAELRRGQGEALLGEEEDDDFDDDDYDVEVVYVRE